MSHIAEQGKPGEPGLLAWCSCLKLLSPPLPPPAASQVWGIHAGQAAAVCLKARAAAAPAQSLHPLAPTARAAAAQTHPAVDGLHQQGAVAGAAGLGAMRLGGARQHSAAGVQLAVMHSEQWEQQRPPAPIAAKSSRPSAPLLRPPEGLLSSASTVSATLCPSACWLYLQEHSDRDSGCCECGGLVSRRN